MKIFIAGICGTFMAGIAQLARSMDYEVTGCDSHVYPPMSTILESSGIEIKEGYLADHLTRHQNAETENTPPHQTSYSQIIIGNALSRGNPLIEALLDNNIPCQSGPQWLHDNLLINRKVIAVAGTHGKTTTSSMVSWILEKNNRSPGFLIGGKPGNFDCSARPGESDLFVIEADEYDTAFFDKRSKFVHYSPNIAILNNLEFDHADIFDNLHQIKKQFHHLVRIIPSNGHIIVNADDCNLQEVLDMGVWSPICSYSLQNPETEWFARSTKADASCFDVFHNGLEVGNVSWDFIGKHNMANALAAIAASYSVGISPKASCLALKEFIPTARRLEKLFNGKNIHLYEDFAHHPTAIRATLKALKQKYPKHQIIAIVEPKSNTMRGGYHGQELHKSFNDAHKSYIYQPKTADRETLKFSLNSKTMVVQSANDLLAELELRITKNSVIICMSNGSFDDIPGRLRERLQSSVVENQT